MELWLCEEIFCYFGSGATDHHFWSLAADRMRKMVWSVRHVMLQDLSICSCLSVGFSRRFVCTVYDRKPGSSQVLGAQCIQYSPLPVQKSLQGWVIAQGGKASPSLLLCQSNSAKSFNSQKNSSPAPLSLLASPCSTLHHVHFNTTLHHVHFNIPALRCINASACAQATGLHRLN